MIDAATLLVVLVVNADPKQGFDEVFHGDNAQGGFAIGHPRHVLAGFHHLRVKLGKGCLGWTQSRGRDGELIVVFLLPAVSSQGYRLSARKNLAFPPNHRRK